MAKVKLQTSNGEIVEVELELAKHFRPVQEMLDSQPNFNEAEVLNLEKVDSDTLKKVLEWVEYHKDDPKPERMDDDDDDFEEMHINDIIPQWDEDYLNVDQGTLLKLLETASYLGLKGLIYVTSKTVADMIKGKSVEEIAATFNIPIQNETV